MGAEAAVTVKEMTMTPPTMDWLKISIPSLKKSLRKFQIHENLKFIENYLEMRSGNTDQHLALTVTLLLLMNAIMLKGMDQ